ncbi:Hsp20/alpha crystallin family protein [Candidatus Peregrinibacteria bacterium]|nr:Hsp20/alpha crystallin family protein [Candidatus Peregrinibacteria bacterium]
MVKLLQRQRPLLAPRTRLGFPLDDSFWNRFWDDYSFRSPFRAMTPFSTDWMPDVDVSETDKEITVAANVAGYEPKDIDIEIEDNVLTIKGEMEKETEEKKRKYYRQERCSGSFFRQIALPPVDETKASCKAKNGTLTITLPKKEAKPIESKARKLAIES